MGTKILGILLMAFAINLFRLGLRLDDKELSYITSIRKIGAAALALMLGFAMLFSDKSLCEAFGIFC